jgi:hypothetical protein
MLTISEAKQMVGRDCQVTYLDRLGNEKTKTLHVHDLTYVPLYGAYLVGDVEDVHLDKVTAIQPL